MIFGVQSSHKKVITHKKKQLSYGPSSLCWLLPIMERKRMRERHSNNVLLVGLAYYQGEDIGVFRFIIESMVA
jgi:hypothetical protein